MDTPREENFELVDLEDLYQAILDKEASLAPDQYLNITNAHLVNTPNGYSLSGIRVTRRPPGPGALAQSIPGHPRLLAAGDSHSTFSEIFQGNNLGAQANGRVRPVPRRTVRTTKTTISPVTTTGFNDFPAQSETVITKEVTTRRRPRPTLRTARRGPRPTLAPVRIEEGGFSNSTFFSGANAYNGAEESTEVDTGVVAAQDEDEIDLFRQGLFDREAMLPPGRVLDISRARPGKGKLSRGVVGARVINPPGQRSRLVPIPGHPGLYTSPDLLNDYVELFNPTVPFNPSSGGLNQPNGRKPQHAFRPDATLQANTKAKVGLKANGRFNQDYNEFSDNDFFDEDEVIRDAIFERMDALPEGRSLDVSNVRINQARQVSGLKTIPTPAPGTTRGRLRRVPGYPKLLVRPNNYNYLVSLMGARLNQSNARNLGSRANGCGCGKL